MFCCTDESSSTFFTRGFPEDFPSYDHESVEDLDGLDLELPDLPHPVRTPSQEKNGPGGDRYQMEFVSSHFGDSSDEDDNFLRGLTFEERSHQRLEPQQVRISPSEARQPVATMDPLGQLMSSVIAQNAGSVLSALGQNLVTSVIGQSTISAQPSRQVQQQPPVARMSRSQQSGTDLEDDFELISDEECQ